MVRPEDAGIGATPARCANATLRARALGVVAGRGEQLAGGLGSDAEEFQQSWSRLLDRWPDLGVEFADLGVHGLVATGQAAR
ncbi:hypothetical protein Sm713_71080 [Streptomyces sp. TS71-3]|nr:hypothetical protein Sm713_71080 [Streptomyces sp. TS71-3]